MGPNPQETMDLVTFTEENLNEKLHFLCTERSSMQVITHKKLTKVIMRFESLSCYLLLVSQIYYHYKFLFSKAAYFSHIDKFLVL